MIIFLVLPLAAMAYISWHVWCLLPLAWGWKTLVVTLLVASFLLLFAGIFHSTDRMPMPLATAVYEIGTSSIFVMLYLFMLFLVMDLGRLVHLLPRTLFYSNWWTVGAITVFLFGLFLYGNLHYQHKYRQELTLTSDKITKPVKAVMLSDLHIGYHNRRDELHRWVDMINSEQPDVILIAGDIIDGSMRPLRDERMHEEFRRLKAPVYACLGNHEYFSGEPDAQRFYRDAGIHLLRDSAAFIPLGTGSVPDGSPSGLCIIGRDDRTNPHRLPLAKIMAAQSSLISHSSFLILLDHQPYHLEQAERQGIDFQFSGHTHYGQVWPISWITDTIYECAFGAHKRGHTNYYVSSGLGIWGGKFRIGTRSEYVVLNLQR
jgi:hypothetical protein